MPQKQIIKENFPKEWEPSKVHLKSGWKNNPKVLQEIVTTINDEMFVESEDEMMEMMDVVLEYLKSKYSITPLK